MFLYLSKKRNNIVPAQTSFTSSYWIVAKAVSMMRSQFFVTQEYEQYIASFHLHNCTVEDYPLLTVTMNVLIMNHVTW